MPGVEDLGPATDVIGRRCCVLSALMTDAVIPFSRRQFGVDLSALRYMIGRGVPDRVDIV